VIATEGVKEILVDLRADLASQMIIDMLGREQKEERLRIKPSTPAMSHLRVVIRYSVDSTSLP
jgi:hypothetical protein